MRAKSKCKGFQQCCWYTDKKGNTIFLICKEIQRDRVQSHMWLMAPSYMVKYLRLSSHIRKPFIIYDFAPDPIWISLCMRKILFSYFYLCKINQPFVPVHAMTAKSLRRPDPGPCSKTFFKDTGFCGKFLLLTVEFTLVWIVVTTVFLFIMLLVLCDKIMCLYISFFLSWD